MFLISFVLILNVFFGFLSQAKHYSSKRCFGFFFSVLVWKSSCFGCLAMLVALEASASSAIWPPLFSAIPVLASIWSLGGKGNAYRAMVHRPWDTYNFLKLLSTSSNASILYAQAFQQHAQQKLRMGDYLDHQKHHEMRR